MLQLLRIGQLCLICIMSLSCNGQTKLSVEPSPYHQQVSSEFDSDTITFYGITKRISSIDTSSGWNLKGQKILLTGVVYQLDGKTPAPDVLLYYYQTNPEGQYLHKPEDVRSMPPNELGQTHGHIRGWVMTDSVGKYSIYTVRPGAYPTIDEPAHIHLTVKEPNEIDEYYIDDFVFDDDVLLSSAARNRLANRSGSGVLRLVQKGDVQIGERNIILGLNIPGYPQKSTSGLNSGRDIGEDVISFIPYHAWGPDMGTRTCPICKYGWYHGILYFVGNNPNWDEIKQWLTFLESESIKREKYLKVYFVYGNDEDYDKTNRENELAKLGEDLELTKVALTFVPSMTDSESEIDLNEINPLADNTFILYKRSRIFDKFINLPPNQVNFNLMSNRLDETINEYFDLPKTEQR